MKRLRKPYAGLPILEVTTKKGHVAAMFVHKSVAASMILGVGEPTYIGWLEKNPFCNHIGEN